MDGGVQSAPVAVLRALVAVRRTKPQLHHHSVTETPVESAGRGGGMVVKILALEVVYFSFKNFSKGMKR